MPYPSPAESSTHGYLFAIACALLCIAPFFIGLMLGLVLVGGCPCGRAEEPSQPATVYDSPAG